MPASMAVCASTASRTVIAAKARGAAQDFEAVQKLFRERGRQQGQGPMQDRSRTARQGEPH